MVNLPFQPSSDSGVTLLLTPDFPPWDGGVAVWAEKLAQFLTRQGRSVVVAAPQQLAEDAQFDARQPYPVVRLRNFKARYLKYLSAHFTVRRLVKTHRPAHILALTWHPFANAALRWAPAAPLTLIAHGNDFMELRWQRPIWRRRMSRAFAGARRVIAVSRETERALARLLPGLAAKTTVLYPGVDPEEFPCLGQPPEPPVLLTLGRVVQRKGQDRVIQALPAILSDFPDAEYWVAGRGSDVPRLQALTRDLRLEHKVRFLGFVPAEERIRLYERCSVYLMPSRTIGERGDFEGFGITYLEANACGRPVIGGRSGGVMDAVLDGETGFLVDPESPEEIATRTLQLLRSPELAARLGAQGRARVERKFNWAVTARRLLELMTS